MEDKEKNIIETLLKNYNVLRSQVQINLIVNNEEYNLYSFLNDKSIVKKCENDSLWDFKKFKKAGNILKVSKTTKKKIQIVMIIKSCLDRLSYDETQLIYLRYFEKKSFRSISRESDCSVNTVIKRIYEVAFPNLIKNGILDAWNIYIEISNLDS